MKADLGTPGAVCASLLMSFSPDPRYLMKARPLTAPSLSQEICPLNEEESGAGLIAATRIGPDGASGHFRY